MSYRWLRRHLPDLPSPEALVPLWVRLGIEVGGMEPVGGEYETVELVEVMTRTSHPDADHLSLVEVRRGDESRVTVVTGAPNGFPGDHLWYGPPGTRLVDGRVLKTVKLRGIPSPGMLMSAEELGLAAGDGDGLWVWDGPEPLGTTFLEVAGGLDTVFDLELTPNLAVFDQSALGLARELAAVLDRRLPELPAPFAYGRDPGLIGEVACPLYGLVAFTVDRLSSTPVWMQTLLRAVGARPISPLVDLTNFVLWDLGEPLHAFDQDAVALPITVRAARDGEHLVGLDGADRTLSPKDLVIADRRGPLALAGVMGGEASAISSRTRRVLLEAAHFSAPGIYQTMRRHRLETEAALRFGKGTDPAAAQAAPTAFLSLLQELGQATVAESAVAGSVPPRRTFAFHGDRVRTLLGVDWDDKTLLRDVERLGFSFQGENVVVPLWRPDVEGLHDLAEEVLRIEGVERISSRPLEGRVTAGGRPLAKERLFMLRRAWVEAGYGEVVTRSFTAPEREAPFLGEAADRAVTVVNPLRDEERTLRQSLLAGLIETVRQNRARFEEPLALFEVGPVFSRGDAGAVRERPELGAVLSLLAPDRWPRAGADPTVLDLKAALEWVWDRIGLEPLQLVNAPPPPWAHPGRVAALSGPGGIRGTVAELHPRLVAEYRTGPLAALVLDLGDPAGWTLAMPLIVRPSRFPTLTRDLSLVLPADWAYARLYERLETAVGRTLERRRTVTCAIRLIDRYEGSFGVSYTFRLVFQSERETLNEETIERVLGRILTDLREEGVELRGS